jgi:hypothetical protein
VRLPGPDRILSRAGPVRPVGRSKPLTVNSSAGSDRAPVSAQAGCPESASVNIAR